MIYRAMAFTSPIVVFALLCPSIEGMMQRPTKSPSLDHKATIEPRVQENQLDSPGFRSPKRVRIARHEIQTGPLISNFGVIQTRPDSSEYSAAVGLILTPMANAVEKPCTGTLVTIPEDVNNRHDIILTAKHCFDDRFGGLAQFFPDNTGNMNSLHIKIFDYGNPEKEGELGDWAVCILERPLPQRERMKVRKNNPQEFRGFVLGYKDSKLFQTRTCKAQRQENTSLFRGGCPSVSGFSGGPFIASPISTGPKFLTGIHITTEGTQLDCQTFTNNCFNKIIGAAFFYDRLKKAFSDGRYDDLP